MPIKLEIKSIYYQVEERKLFMEQFHLPYLEVTFQLLAYDWPGNVRELENLIARALILSRMADGEGFLRFDRLSGVELSAKTQRQDVILSLK